MDRIKEYIQVNIGSTFRIDKINFKWYHENEYKVNEKGMISMVDKRKGIIRMIAWGIVIVFAVTSLGVIANIFM